MTDREKVIIGLECWTNPSPYINTVDCMLKKCPYAGNDHCDLEIFNSALELLKAQEPRVLTIEEATIGDECWFEHRNGTCGYASCFMHRASQTVEVNRIMHNPEFLTLNSFMKSWRCWTSRPTDEQRRAVKWDD